jgi:alpha-galactosidase
MQMAKIVYIGAGSHQFARRLITDILCYPELRESTITLMDIAKDPLELITSFTRKLCEQQGFKTRIESTTDRRKALEGANYVITTIRVGGQAAAQADRAVAEKYELKTGNIIGPIGVFDGAREVPVLLDICRDMEELCPDAWLINYTNPMAINSWAISDYSRIKNVGLCHSVQHTATELAKYIGVPYEEISFWTAGINHMAWFLDFRWRGEDAYPILRERFKDPEVYSAPDAHWDGPDIVRAEVFKTFGYYVTECSTIMAEYVPYFRKRNRPDLFDKYKLRKVESKAAAKDQVNKDEELKQQIKSNFQFPMIHSGEYVSIIIRAIETGIPARINGNVKNTGLITNLPEGCCVEVPCLVDKEGIKPCFVGDLPAQLAALNRTNISVQELAVRGIAEKDRTKMFHAMLLDPLSASMLTIDEIRQMTDEMFTAGAQYLQGYK